MTPSRFYLLICFLSFPLQAQTTETNSNLLLRTQSQPTYDINTVEPGGLYFATQKPGRAVRAPTLKSDIEITVNGPLVHTRVTQQFQNTGTAWVEGMYTYPLPKGSAVDLLEMKVGERIIKGEIQEKQQANRTFEKAASEGKRASLVIQKRPNIFTTRLANIGPGETIEVSIEYQDLIEPRDNIFELRFPMVVRPRYIPGIPLDTTRIAEGWGFDTDQVPDGASITQPYVLKSAINQNLVNLSVNLNAGFPLGSLASPSHAVTVQEFTTGATIKFQDQGEAADQDFILRWTPEASSTPQVGVFTETTKAGTHHLVMVMPPNTDTTKEDDTNPRGRELLIVLDRSGSMGGQAIAQAKAAVRRAILRLTHKDTFNIIAFSSDATPLFGASKPVTEEAIHTALDFIDSVEAGGGTEMSGALSLALPEQATENSENPRMKQVIFVTDGAVGNEAALMDQIKRSINKARLFTVGIGSAPNNFFMSEAAIQGRGTYINIAMNDNVLDAMNRLFQKIESPQMTGLELSGLQTGDDVVPGTIPDLYSGEPVVALIKSNTDDRADMKLEGTLSDKVWSQTISSDHGSTAKGIANLWARRKIEAVNRDYVGNRYNMQDERRERILDLSLTYHLVSEFTSLVAVDQTPARPASESLFKRQTPANLPAGMEPARFSFAHGAKVSAFIDKSLKVKARSTATPMMLNLVIGLSLLLVACLILLFQNRRIKQS